MIRMPTLRQAIVLFSPAVVLIVWAVVCALDGGHVSDGEIMFFLFLLGVSVAWAERVRGTLRRKMFDQIARHHDRRPPAHS